MVKKSIFLKYLNSVFVRCWIDRVSFFLSIRFWLISTLERCLSLFPRFDPTEEIFFLWLKIGLIHSFFICFIIFYFILLWQIYWLIIYCTIRTIRINRWVGWLAGWLVVKGEMILSAHCGVLFLIWECDCWLEMVFSLSPEFNLTGKNYFWS